MITQTEKLRPEQLETPMSKIPKQPSILGGRVCSVPAYYMGQNASGVPDHYLSTEAAKKLKSSGQARSIHRGTAVLIHSRPRVHFRTNESHKSGWRVVGQTQRKGLRPGFPRWGSV